MKSWLFLRLQMRIVFLVSPLSLLIVFSRIVLFPFRTSTFLISPEGWWSNRKLMEKNSAEPDRRRSVVLGWRTNEKSQKVNDPFNETSELDRVKHRRGYREWIHREIQPLKGGLYPQPCSRCGCWRERTPRTLSTNKILWKRISCLLFSVSSPFHKSLLPPLQLF